MRKFSLLQINALRLLFSALPYLFLDDDNLRNLSFANVRKTKFIENTIDVSRIYFPTYKFVSEAPLFLLLKEDDYIQVEPFLNNFGNDQKHWQLFFSAIIRNIKRTILLFVEHEGRRIDNVLIKVCFSFSKIFINKLEI